MVHKNISPIFVSAVDIPNTNITQSDMSNNDNKVLTEAVFYTLIALYSPLHGYGIMQETERMSHGRLKLSAGTLYGAISTMLEKDWIKALPSEEDSRRKEYQITELGKTVVIAELARLEELVENGKKIIEKRF